MSLNNFVANFFTFSINVADRLLCIRVVFLVQSRLLVDVFSTSFEFKELDEFINFPSSLQFFMPTPA